MEVNKDNCAIRYSKQSRQLEVDGAMRLMGTESYSELSQMLNTAVEDNHLALTLDIRKLRFLNSSGINVFFRFLIALRKQDRTTLTIRGTKDYHWQQKTLLNFKKILPSTVLEI